MSHQVLLRGVLGLLLHATVAIEDVKTTRFIDGDFTHDLIILGVLFTAGSINST